MADEYYKAIISATSEREAKAILKALLNKRLVAGGLIVKGPSLYWWKGKIVEEIYYNLSVYTILKKRDEIINVVEGMCKDEVSIIEFHRIDYGNKGFLRWIDEYTK